MNTWPVNWLEKVTYTSQIRIAGLLSSLTITHQATMNFSPNPVTSSVKEGIALTGEDLLTCIIIWHPISCSWQFFYTIQFVNIFLSTECQIFVETFIFWIYNPFFKYYTAYLCCGLFLLNNLFYVTFAVLNTEWQCDRLAVFFKLEFYLVTKIIQPIRNKLFYFDMVEFG